MASIIHYTISQIFTLLILMHCHLTPSVVMSLPFYTFLAAGVEVVSIDAIVKEPSGVIIGMTLIRVCCNRDGTHYIILY